MTENWVRSPPKHMNAILLALLRPVRDNADAFTPSHDGMNIYADINSRGYWSV